MEQAFRIDVCFLESLQTTKGALWMQATRIKELNLMTGRHFCGFYVVAVPDEYARHAGREAQRKHSKSPGCPSYPSVFGFFLMCQKTSQVLFRLIPQLDIVLLLNLLQQI